MNRRLIPAIAVLALVAAACGGAAGGSGGKNDKGGKIAYSKGAEDLVLRIAFAGGFVMPTTRLTEIPQVSLFGDGSYFVQGPQIEIFPGPALPNLLVRKIGEPGMQAILAAAKEAGLMNGNRRLEDNTVADAPTTVFTVVADGKKHVVEAVALGEGIGGGQDPTFRKDLQTFRDLMTDLPRWLPKGSVGSETPYQPKAVRVVVEPYQKVADAPPQNPMAWPAGKLGEFGNARNEAPGLRCGVARDADAAKVLSAARSANVLTPWRSDGKEYRLQFRPLLPDESGC